MTKPLPLLTIQGRGITRTLNSRVLQSPLAGVSDQIFRQLVRRWAPEALLFTEMVSASGLKRGHGDYKVEELSEEPGPIGVQLFDHHPEAMVEAGLTDDDIDVVAATHGPGLIGSLLIGVSAAKALALGWGLPFIGINHHEAHLYAALIEEPEMENSEEKEEEEATLAAE